MADIQIKDTGKRYVGASVLAGEKKAYGDSGVGTALTLQGVRVTFGQRAVTTADTIVNYKKNNTSTEAFEFGEATHQGIESPTWIVNGYVNRENESEMIALGRLIYMVKTKGYKELYSSTANNFYDIIAYSKYGEREAASESTKTVSYINVRITDIQIQQSADKRGFNYTLNLVEIN